MRLPTYLVKNGPSGLYHFRWIVPKAWRSVLGRKVIKRSLGTADPRTAQIHALALAGRYASALRGVPVADKTLDELLEQARRKQGLDFEIQAGPHGYSVKTDGTPEDNRDALEALKALQRPAEAVSGPLPALTPVAKRKALQTAVQEWLAVINGKHADPKTRQAKAKAVTDFTEWLVKRAGNKVSKVALPDVAAEDCGQWLISLQAVRPQPAPRHLQNKFYALADFFDWAMTNGLYPKGENPARGHIKVSKKYKRLRAKTHGWQAFTDDQLRAIFEPDQFITIGKDEGARWLPVMALYLGARSNELAQLELPDFKKVDGVDCIHFTIEGEQKSLKNEASERMTPIHPDLVKLGLLARVERLRTAGETKLFPGLNFTAINGPAGRCQHAFNRYLEKLGITARGEAKVGLHSFRDTVVQKLQDGGVVQELRHDFVGHEQTTMGDHRDSYGKQTPVKTLAKQCLPALSWSKDKFIDLRKMKKLLVS